MEKVRNANRQESLFYLLFECAFNNFLNRGEVPKQQVIKLLSCRHREILNLLFISCFIKNTN